jgi:hypothetical protein
MYGTGSGNKRYGFDFSAVAGKDYLVVFDILNARVSDNLDAVSDISGSAVAFRSKVLSGTSGVVFHRATASTTAIRYARLAPAPGEVDHQGHRHPPDTRIDVAALIVAAPTQ